MFLLYSKVAQFMYIHVCIYVCVCVCEWHSFPHVIFHHFFFLGLHLQHMEFPGLGVKLELQLPTYAIATAMPDP